MFLLLAASSRQDGCCNSSLLPLLKGGSSVLRNLISAVVKRRRLVRSQHHLASILVRPTLGYRIHLKSQKSPVDSELRERLVIQPKNARMHTSNLRKRFLVCSSWKIPWTQSPVSPSGLQSNHCRATAVCAKLLGLEPHVVLLVPGHGMKHRTQKSKEKRDKT